ADDDRAGRSLGRAAPAGANRRRRIAALRADAGDEERQRRRDLAHAGDLGRVGGADDEADLAAVVPGGRGEAGDSLVDALARREAQVLQVVAAGVRGAAEQDRALAFVAQVRRDRIEAEQRRQRHRVGAIADEDFARVLL